MVYTFKNPEYTKALSEADFWERVDVDTFQKTLMLENVSYVESLVKIKASFLTFIKSARKGNTIFSDTNCWPETADIVCNTLYYTSADYRFQSAIASISSALDNMIGILSGEQPNQVGRDHQNAFNQLAELRLNFSFMMNDQSLHWDRTRAESRMSATWLP